MIREEYDFRDIAEYLYKTTDLLIAGVPTCEERSYFFSDLWKDKGKMVLQLKTESNDKLTYQIFYGKTLSSVGTIDLCIQTPQLLQSLSIEQKNILLDLSSLEHVLRQYRTNSV